MTAFKKFDPRAFLERERLSGAQTLAPLATLAAPPLENENRESGNRFHSGDSLAQAESRGSYLTPLVGISRAQGCELAKIQNLTPTPAKAAKVAKDDSNFSNFSSLGPSKTEYDPSPYASALTALCAKCPDFVPNDRWQLAVEDGWQFLAVWGAEAWAFGWTVPELFGLHPVPEQPAANYARLARLDETGLVWLLRRRPIVALTETTAAIQGATAFLTYRKINKPALGPVGDSLDDWGAT
jgi:hypothetical protein